MRQAGRPRRLFERLPPPVYFFACFLGGWALDRPWRLPLGFEGLPQRLVSGGLMITLAVALAAWSLVLFRRSRTTPQPFGLPTALLTAGPFRRSRNPLYGALGLVLAGFAVLLDNGWILISVGLMLWALDRFIVPGEEARLHELFGERYREYCRDVRRWL